MTDATALTLYATRQDPQAFKHLVETYQRLAYSVCRRRLRNPADVDDAVQQVFIKLAQNAGRIQGNLASWVYAAATNAAIDVYRRATTRQGHEQHAAKEAGAERYPGAQEPLSPEEKAAWAETCEHLDDALKELSEDDHAVIVAYYFAGHTQQHIAEVHGVTQSAIKRRLDRAVIKLRQALATRGVHAAGVGLGVLLAEQSAMAVPAALTASLNKVGLSGVGQAASSTAASAAASSGAAAGSAAVSASKAGLLGTGLGKAAAALIAGGSVLGGAALMATQEENAPDHDSRFVEINSQTRGAWVAVVPTPDGDFGTIHLDVQSQSMSLERNFPQQGSYSFEAGILEDQDLGPYRQWTIEFTGCVDETRIGERQAGLARFIHDDMLEYITYGREDDIPNSFDPVTERGSVLVQARRIGSPLIFPEGSPVKTKTVPGRLMLVYRQQVSVMEMGWRIAGEFIPNLMMEIEDAGLEPAGQPELLYNDVLQIEPSDPQRRVEIAIAIPVREEKPVRPDFEWVQEPARKVAYLKHTGAVMDMQANGQAWETLLTHTYQAQGVRTRDDRSLTLHWGGDPMSRETVTEMQVTIENN